MRKGYKIDNNNDGSIRCVFKIVVFTEHGFTDQKEMLDNRILSCLAFKISVINLTLKNQKPLLQYTLTYLSSMVRTENQK